MIQQRNAPRRIVPQSENRPTAVLRLNFEKFACRKMPTRKVFAQSNFALKIVCALPIKGVTAVHPKIGGRCSGNFRDRSQYRVEGVWLCTDSLPGQPSSDRIERVDGYEPLIRPTQECVSADTKWCPRWK